MNFCRFLRSFPNNTFNLPCVTNKRVPVVCCLTQTVPPTSLKIRDRSDNEDPLLYEPAHTARQHDRVDSEDADTSGRNV